MFEGNLSYWLPGVNVVVSYKMADNEDLLDNLTDAIQALNVAIGEVSLCKASEMVAELQDMRDHLVRRLEAAEHGASVKHRQARKLIALAKKLMAAGPGGKDLLREFTPKEKKDSEDFDKQLDEQPGPESDHWKSKAERKS